MDKENKRDWDIYIDVDGVLLYLNENINRFCLRNGIIEFLFYVTNNFKNCYWLTAWYDGFNDILEKIYCVDIAQKIEPMSFKEFKTENIDFNRKFLIIEDGLIDEEISKLKENNCLENYIQVSYNKDANYLFKVIDIINSKIYKD